MANRGLIIQGPMTVAEHIHTRRCRLPSFPSIKARRANAASDHTAAQTGKVDKGAGNEAKVQQQETERPARLAFGCHNEIDSGQ